MARTEADRARAYEDLAVANTSPPLLPEQTGYFELVSSPDPRVEPYVFALEHAKVRLGRFTLDSSYATSPDVYVAVIDTATAIAPMNMMFEYIDGAFHAFDTRSKHGTFVNGDQINKRRKLAPGDVIDLGGSPEAGGARLRFLGTTAPARAIRRAPTLTRHTYVGPRRGMSAEIDSTTGAGVATLAIGGDWGDAAIAAAAHVATVASPFLATTSIDGDTLRYAAGGPVEPIAPRRVLDERTARTIAADVCEAAAACHPVLCGPFDRRLVFTRPNGRAVLYAAGVSRIAYRHDSVLRGAVMAAMHFACSPEELANRTEPGPATDVWYAASFYMSLQNGGFEPFPIDDDPMVYWSAVKRGAPADAPAWLAPAFAADPAARPSLAALAKLLR